MKGIRGIPLALAFAFTLAVSAPARADGDPIAFVQKETGKVTELLKQPANAGRDTQISKLLEGVIDYSELTRRTFGAPCPATLPNCTDHWKDLSEAQRAEASDLLRKIVEKNYRKNLIKTLDFDVTFKGMKEANNGDARVRTEAKSKVKPRDPVVLIDYVVQTKGDTRRIVDIVTEGSSLTKNYYDQFHKYLTNESQGYPHVVKKLREKLEKMDKEKDK